MKLDKKFIFIFLLAILSRIVLFSDVNFGWDESVYIMNAKYEIGDQIYYEVIRPPQMQTLLGISMLFFGVSDLVVRIFPILVSIFSIVLTWVFCKRLFGENTAVFSSLFMIVNPAHLMWSHIVHTEILSSVFVLLSLLFYFEWREKARDNFLYIAIFFCGIAGITRFTANILFIFYILHVFVFEKARVFKRKYLLSILIFILINLIWISWNFVFTGDPFYSYRWTLVWASGEISDPLFYLIASPQIFSFEIVFLILGFFILLKDWKKEKYLSLLVLSFIFILFHQAFIHKEIRFLLPIIPVLVIISSIGINDIFEKMKQSNRSNGFLLVISIFMIASYLQGFLPINIGCSNDAIVLSSEFIGTQEYGRVLSMFWPITSLHSGYPVKAFPEDPEEFRSFVEIFDISYVQVSDIYGWPEYAKDFTFFELDYLELSASFEDECQKAKVYKVI